MRLLIIALILLSAAPANARRGRWTPATEYLVVSDSVDTKVPKGKCLVYGKIISNFGIISGATVANMNRTHSTTTDTLGTYSFYVPAIDTSIFFYKEGYDGIVVWSYNFQSQHKVQIDFYLETQQMISFKPVIYAYSDEDLIASVKINPFGEFTFTYPAYNDGWDVKVLASGGLGHNQQEYPYLFWESTNPLQSFSGANKRLEGFVVKSDEFASFLEIKMSTVGLNEQETTDMITFWGPKVTHKEYVLIQFLEDDDYENKIATIEIDPKPTSMKRIYLLCAELDNPDIGYEVVPQSLDGFERNGFTVVEWGGSIINLENNEQ